MALSSWHRSWQSIGYLHAHCIHRLVAERSAYTSVRLQSHPWLSGATHNQLHLAAPMETRLQEQLDRRQREGSLRSLMPLPTAQVSTKPKQQLPIDFASNDYLGLARCRNQHNAVELAYSRLFCNSQDMDTKLGATGSRLLSGDSRLARSIEAKLAEVHNRPAALLFNSGYDANLSILSSLPYKEGDAIVMDELVHNSLVMGVRMGRLNQNSVFLFKHNDVNDLKRVLEKVASSSASSPSSTLIVVESVYSMDGDIAPLKEILELAEHMEGPRNWPGPNSARGKARRF